MIFLAVLLLLIFPINSVFAADFGLFGQQLTPTPTGTTYSSPYGTPAGGGGGSGGGGGGGGGGGSGGGYGTPSGGSAVQNGLSATYFDNDNFTGTTISVVDPFINFNWKLSAPYPSMGKDTFSVVWSGQIFAPNTGTYTFYAATDDGVRVYVNNQLIINRWRVKSAYQVSGGIKLEGGRTYPIRVEYFEKTNRAQAKLSWSAQSITPYQIKIGKWKITRNRTNTLIRKQVIPTANLFVK